MATLYLIEQNTILRKQGQRLLLCKRPPAKRRYSAVLQGDILLDLPVGDVDQVMLFGNIQVTTSALQLLLGKGIEVALFSFGGDLLGQLTPVQGKNVPLRIEQFRRWDDPAFTLNFAKAVVEAKLENARALLLGFQKNHAGVLGADDLEIFAKLIAALPEVADLERLRGVEGAAGAQYFRLFGRMILPPWRFEGRNKRPPRDPVNAVLSYGYVVVAAQLQSLLDGVGLDPYLGFYHQIRYGRPSLALDLLEEFRHPLVDRLCLTLFNKQIVEDADFYRPATGGVYLSTSGKRKFFTHYQSMLGEISSGLLMPAPESEGYSSLFQRQAERLVKSLQSETAYEPYRLIT